MVDCPNKLEHLLAEVRRIELKLHDQVRQLQRDEIEPADDRFRGLYISESEVDAIVDRPFSSATALAEEAVATTASSQQVNVMRRLRRLQQLFKLSDFDIDVLLICILPELDLRYQKLFGYLQDDITKKSPTVNLVIDVLHSSFDHRIKARQAFSAEAPLVQYQLIQLQDGQNYRPSPLLARFLQVDERIIDYLLGQDRIDRRLLPIAHLISPRAVLPEPVLPEDTRQQLNRLAAHFRDAPLIVQFLGNEGVGRQSTVRTICQQFGTLLLAVDAASISNTDMPLELLLQIIFREGQLQNAAIYLDHFDSLLPANSTASSTCHTFTTELAGYPNWVFLAGERRWQPDEKIFQQPLFYVELPDPPYQTRRELWAKFGNHNTPLSDDVCLDDVAGRFRLSGGQIENAMAAARSLALWRNPADGTVTAQDIYTACRQQSGYRLGSLANKISPQYGWDDIILPGDQISELHEICGHVKYRHTVYGDWGFEKKHPRGKGLNVLFAGPSGTGKTMAAEIMANELGIDLYRIDLAGIVSKYIGETEKNLDRIFQEGKTANAILFFDEADALFGKRSEVRDSHDRYANIEVAYLLQKMEEYDGIVILATNLRKNMDEAFARRMHFSIEFPIPEEADRLRIWQSVFPVEAPLAPEADLKFMARQFRITGGNIKNIALGAAFFAAEKRRDITMEDLIRATKREYQKMGRLCTESEFGQFFNLVRS